MQKLRPDFRPQLLKRCLGCSIAAPKNPPPTSLKARFHPGVQVVVMNMAEARGGGPTGASLSLSLARAYSLSLSLSHTHTHTHALSLSPSLSLSRTLSLSLSRSRFPISWAPKPTPDWQPSLVGHTRGKKNPLSRVLISLSEETYFSVISWQRKFVHNLLLLVILKHLCSNVCRQEMKEK